MFGLQNTKCKLLYTVFLWQSSPIHKTTATFIMIHLWFNAPYPSYKCFVQCFWLCKIDPARALGRILSKHGPEVRSKIKQCACWGVCMYVCLCVCMCAYQSLYTLFICCVFPSAVNFYCITSPNSRHFARVSNPLYTSTGNPRQPFPDRQGPLL